MVFHYFDGFGPKWIAATIALGGTLASAATYVYRGGGKSYFSEIGMQDSESSLAPTVKSMTKKVKEVPQQAKSGSSSFSPSSSETPSSANAASKQNEPAPQFTYRDLSTTSAISSAHSITTRITEKADFAAKSFGENAQAAVNWIAENPKTTIAFCLLVYAVQHLGRKVLAHQHYEDRLITDKRISQKPLESGTSSTFTAADGEQTGTNSVSSATSPSNNYNSNGSNFSGTAFTPSAVASGYDEDAGDEVDYAARNEREGADDVYNGLPVSTWASRARPRHADPEFERLVQNLTPELLQEFTRFLLPAAGDVTTEDADLVTRVRDEILSIAPAVGWTAKIVVENEQPGKQAFRFVNRQGEVKKIHGDAEFALDMLQREASKRNAARTNSKLEAAAATNNATSSPTASISPICSSSTAVGP